MTHRSPPHRPVPYAPGRAIAAIAAATLLLGGCGETSLPSVPLLSVYRIDIQQGNVITQEQLAALEPGMEKRKVRFILGTPLVADAFNPDRWDYYYSLEKRGEDRVQRVISVYFKDERLVRVGGDVRPAAGPIVVDNRKDELVSVPEGYLDEGILASLTPGLFSKRRKFQPPAAPDGTAEQSGNAPAPAETPSPVEVSAEDARYLRELLDGFGMPGPASTAAPPPAGQPAGQDEEESLFERWARRLGIGDDESPETAPPDAAQPAAE